MTIGRSSIVEMTDPATTFVQVVLHSGASFKFKRSHIFKIAGKYINESFLITYVFYLDYNTCKYTSIMNVKELYYKV